jgi:tetratricopeptide (TPR) repeat protein
LGGSRGSWMRLIWRPRGGQKFADWIPAGRLLLVVDYAASKQEPLGYLLSRAAQWAPTADSDARLRILLLEREADPKTGWFHDLLRPEGDAVREALARSLTFKETLRPIEADSAASAVRELARATFRAYAAFSGDSLLDAGALSDPTLEHLARICQNRPLIIQMAALQACAERDLAGLAHWTLTDLFNHVCERERDRLRRECVRQGCGSRGFVDFVGFGLAALTLLGERPPDDVTWQALLASYAQGRADFVPARCVDILESIYGSEVAQGDTRVAPVQPDLLGGAFFVHVLREQAAATAAEYVARIVDAGESEAWPRLSRVAQDLQDVKDYQALETWLLQLLRQQGSPAWQKLLAAVVSGGQVDAERSPSWLLRVGDACTPAELGPTHDLIPEHTTVLRPFAVLSCEKALAAIPRGDEWEEERARVLCNLGVRRDALGCREEALEPTERAVEIRERLARRNPDAFEPDLAMSLNNLGALYSALGRQEEALGATERAVEIGDRMARRNPAAFEPGLAMSLNNLGLRYNALGRREEALEATVRAVEIRERLARSNPTAFEPELAMSLDNLGILCNALGRREEALRVTERAAEICERAAEGNPDAFEPDFAIILSNLGVRYDALGWREEALDVTKRAVAICQRLARHNPDAFEPYLASSLSNLGVRYNALHRQKEALEPTERAAEIRERLARHNPDAFEADLALSLNNLGVILRTLGRREEALGVTERAVAVYERLARHNPGAFEADLAMSLSNLGLAYDALGRREEALGATERAVEIRQGLARRNPNAFEAKLASSLSDLGLLYCALSRQEKALGVSERAVEICQRLARLNPNAFEPELARSLNNLGLVFDALGRREEARSVTMRAVEIYQRLAARSAGTFESNLAVCVNNLANVYSNLGRRGLRKRGRKTRRGRGVGLGDD